MGKWRIRTVIAGSLYTRMHYMHTNLLCTNQEYVLQVAVLALVALAAGARAENVTKLGTVVGIDLGTTYVPSPEHRSQHY